MWKYVSRRIRDTFERSVNHLDRRSTTAVVNPANNAPDDPNKRSAAICRWFSSQRCWNSFKNDSGTNSNRWNFDQLNRSWIGAITWSSALVAGLYTSQLIHLHYKKCTKEDRQKSCLAVQNLISLLYPYCNANIVGKNAAPTAAGVAKLLEALAPTAHLISDERNGATNRRHTSSSSSDTSTNPDSTDELGDVLNSIENRLGLAAIENGQHQDGLNLLRSAANRKHAPAMYNLGLCYEIGIGVGVDEKAAMEFYRSAAALEHPGALYNLGIYYGQGRGGLGRDTDTAMRLLKLAATLGQQDAIDALKALDAETHPQTWEYTLPPYTPSESIVPMFTNLFVENVNYSWPQSPTTVN